MELGIIIISIGVILSGYHILKTFYFYDKDNLLKVNDALQFVGSYGGAALGTIMTYLVLYVTIEQQFIMTKEQRAIDKQEFEINNQNFKKQVQIQILNEKINDYKCFFKSNEKLIESYKRLIDDLNNYKYNYMEFKNELITLFSETYDFSLKKVVISNENKNKETKIDIYNFEDIGISIDNNYRNENEYILNSNCISEEDLKRKIESYLIINRKCNYDINSLISFHYSSEREKKYGYHLNKGYKKMVDEEKKVIELVDICVNDIHDLIKELKDVGMLAQQKINEFYIDKYN
jgi:hypothetical protein